MENNILFYSDVPSPYKVDFLNFLGQRFRINVLFETKGKKHRDTNWYKYEFFNFSYSFLNEKSKIKRIIYSFTYDIRNYSLFITTNYLAIESIIFSFRFRFSHKKVLLHADGGIVKERGFLKKNIISFIMKLASDYASSGYYTNLYFNDFGVDNKKIHNYHFSSLLKEDIVNNRNMEKKQNENVFTFLYVGQIIYRKGVDLLFKIAKKLPENSRILIVGGKYNPELLDNYTDEYTEKKIIFIDFCVKEQLKKYYANADVFILPTREDIWGLVINEAMSFGLPVLSTDKCIAALEMKKQYGNCIVVPSDDEEALLLAATELYNNFELREMLKEKSLEAIKSFSIENMVEDYSEIINEILNRV